MVFQLKLKALAFGYTAYITRVLSLIKQQIKHGKIGEKKRGQQVYKRGANQKAESGSELEKAESAYPAIVRSTNLAGIGGIGGATLCW